MAGIRKKSYAFVLPWSLDVPGGVNEVVRNLIEEFSDADDYHPILIESHWPSLRPVVERRAHYTYIRVRLWPLDGPSIKIPLAFLLTLPFALRTLKSLATRYHIQAFNVHFPGLAALSWIALRNLRLFRGKVILSFHGSDIRSAYALRGWPRLAYRFMLRQADVLVSCSEGLQSEVLAFEPRAKSCVVYNGLDESRFGRESVPTALSTQLQQREVILNIGKYEFRKAHDLLLRAFSHLLDQHPAAHLVIVGANGPELEKTTRTVEESGLTERVTLYHDLPHSAIPGLLGHARLFVLSSRWVPGKLGEGFPVAILEAAAAGTPVVTTRTCGAAEIIEDGVTGRLVDLEDARGLAEAMCSTLDNAEQARTMAENLRAKVRSQFTWKRAYQSYAGLCEALERS